MEISLKKARAAFTKFEEIHPHLSDCGIDINFSYDAIAGQYQFNMVYRYMDFETLVGMHMVSKQVPILTFRLACKESSTTIGHIASESGDVRTRTIVRIDAEIAKIHKSLKLQPEKTNQLYQPRVIQHAPYEITKGDYTYRLLTGSSNLGTAIEIISRNDEPLYDYLDKGFYVMNIGGNKYAETRYIVSDEYNLHTAHIFMMCSMQPDLADMLTNRCFINSSEASTLRLKLYKKLVKGATDYDALSKSIDEDHQKNTTGITVARVLGNEVSEISVNDIKFTKTRASYERVSIEANDLLDVLYKRHNFDDEFDIYSVCATYTAYLEESLDKLIEKQGTVREAIHDYGQCEINGIPISISVREHGQRYINNVRINKDEIAKAIYRASCYHDEHNYTLFLKSISNLSIKCHDVIANGVAVKINVGLTSEDYRNPEPPESAPRLNFEIDKESKVTKLVISPERKIKISLPKLLPKVERLNELTNNNWTNRADYRGMNYHSHRDSNWAQERLIMILRDATAKVNEANRKTYLINDDDLKKLFAGLYAERMAIIAKSREFLEMAVKLTKAEVVEFMNQKAYKVQGAFRTYAVIESNAKVYDYETKKYRCIVNDKHYKGAGYDDVAARLLTLANDRQMSNDVTTLKSEHGQPGAENAHAYHPERELIAV
jgi:hypothetical protein